MVPWLSIHCSRWSEQTSSGSLTMCLSVWASTRKRNGCWTGEFSQKCLPFFAKQSILIWNVLTQTSQSRGVSAALLGNTSFGQQCCVRGQTQTDGRRRWLQFEVQTGRHCQDRCGKRSLAVASGNRHSCRSSPTPLDGSPVPLHSSLHAGLCDGGDSQYITPDGNSKNRIRLGPDDWHKFEVKMKNLISGKVNLSFRVSVLLPVGFRIFEYIHLQWTCRASPATTSPWRSKLVQVSAELSDCFIEPLRWK